MSHSPADAKPLTHRAPTIEHFFTVDVEEYFQVSAFDAVLTREQWSRFPGRLDESMRRLLEALDHAGAKGTFFTLGWVAKHRPNIVKAIAAAGHELASHGYWHRRVNSTTPAAFREDVRSSKRALEDLSGRPVLGYRAPSFSITPGTEWAFDVLLEEDYRYDSSLFPIRRSGYGYPNALRVPHQLRRIGGTLGEFPLATASIAGLRLPAAGGGYMRQLPFRLIRHAFQQATDRGVPATFYMHPWEIDPDQPRLQVGALTRLRHYRGLSAMFSKIQALLREFRFTTIASYLDRVAPVGRAAS